MPVLKVLIADDHEIVRQGLRSLERPRTAAKPWR